MVFQVEIREFTLHEEFRRESQKDAKRADVQPRSYVYMTYVLQLNTQRAALFENIC